MSDSSKFWRNIAEANERARAADSALPRERARLVAEEPSRSSRRAVYLVSLAAAVTLCGLAALWFWPRSLVFQLDHGVAAAAGRLGSPLLAPAAQPLGLSFSDGSHVQLAPAAQARVMNMDTHGASLLLEHGRAEVSVVPRAGANWRVLAGSFEVAVKGTRFWLSWDPGKEELDFHLHEGRVVISGPCLQGARVLTAGQALRASCQTPRAAGVSPAAAAATRSVASLIEPALAAPSAAALELEPAWRKLALAHDYRQALAAAERAGFENVCRQAAGADLLALGDAARLSGSPARAVEAYAAARRKGSLGRTAFGLGLVEFDRKHFEQAATWFETYAREQPGGPLSEEAQGRTLESWLGAGRPERGQELASSYLSRHPRGTYAELARRVLSR